MRGVRLKLRKDRWKVHRRTCPLTLPPLQLPLQLPLQPQAYREEVPPIAESARRFIEEQLTTDGLSCYWVKAITLYSKIWYATSGSQVPNADDPALFKI